MFREDGIEVAKRKWLTPELVILVRGAPSEDILGCCKNYPSPAGPIAEWGRCGSNGPRTCGARNSAYEPGGTDYACGDNEPTCNDACCGTLQQCGVGGCTGCGNSCKKSTNS